MEWTDADRAAASVEGWDLFDAYGPEEVRLELQRLDEEAILDSDDDAWMLVVARAREGSELHRKVLCVLKREQPDELDDILTANPR